MMSLLVENARRSSNRHCVLCRVPCQFLPWLAVVRQNLLDWILVCCVAIGGEREEGKKGGKAKACSLGPSGN